jgi:hypothetical protein
MPFHIERDGNTSADRRLFRSQVRNRRDAAPQRRYR